MPPIEVARLAQDAFPKNIVIPDASYEWMELEEDGHASADLYVSAAPRTYLRPG